MRRHHAFCEHRKPAKTADSVDSADITHSANAANVANLSGCAGIANCAGIAHFANIANLPRPPIPLTPPPSPIPLMRHCCKPLRLRRHRQMRRHHAFCEQRKPATTAAAINFAATTHSANAATVANRANLPRPLTRHRIQ